MAAPFAGAAIFLSTKTDQYNFPVKERFIGTVFLSHK